MTLDIAPLYGPTQSQRRSGMARVFEGLHSSPATHDLSRNGMLSQPKLVLIYRPRMDGRVRVWIKASVRVKLGLNLNC